jgi:hypothetical protein
MSSSKSHGPFWPDKARLVISISMHLKPARNRIAEPAVPFQQLTPSILICPFKNGTSMVLRKAFLACWIYGTGMA